MSSLKFALSDVTLFLLYNLSGLKKHYIKVSDLDLSVSYLCFGFFIFVLIFIMINRTILWIQMQLFFCLFFYEYVLLFWDDNIYEEYE